MTPEVGGETSNRSWKLVGGRMGMGMETRCFPLSNEAGVPRLPWSSSSPDVKRASGEGMDSILANPAPTPSPLRSSWA